jgi:hypothetical protein
MVSVLRLRGPCCEFAEHDQKASNCEHGFPTSRHDLLAPLVLIEPERVELAVMKAFMLMMPMSSDGHM